MVDHTGTRALDMTEGAAPADLTIDVLPAADDIELDYQALELDYQAHHVA